MSERMTSEELRKAFLEFFKEFQKNDLVGCCAQTDVKGDRSLRPADQADPDLYLRVVEKDASGQPTNKLVGVVMEKHQDAYVGECKM